MTARRPDPQDLADLPPLTRAQRRAVAAGIVAVVILFAIALMTFGVKGPPPGESYYDVIDRWVQEEYGIRTPAATNSAGL